MKLVYPVPVNSIISQNYAEHVQSARAHGWCYKPGSCPGGVYYYGGIDWAVPTGTPVVAAAPGRIEVQDQGGAGYGLNVRIMHVDGYYTIYAHLKSTVVKTGDDAVAGKLIAYSNDTGNSSGPHIHFELRHNGTPEDPAPYLTGLIQPPQPQPIPIPVPFVLFDIPDLPKVRTTTAITKWINIRLAPSADAFDLGDIHTDDIVKVFAIHTDGQGNIWFGVLLDMPTGLPIVGWAAAEYQGEVWLEAIK